MGLSKIILLISILFYTLACSKIFSQGWQIQYNNSSEEYYDLYFINSNTGWAIETHSTGKILKTTNRGMNWIGISQNQFHDGTGIYFINEFTGWISGSSGQLNKSTNGGYNWIHSNCSCSNADDFTDIQFINQTTGWAFGDLGIFKSTDGGSSYFELPNRNYVWTGMFLDSIIGFTIGVDALSKSTDGGISWQRIFFPFGDYKYAMYFNNAQTGWVANSSGKIYKTTNAGVDWTQQLFNNQSTLRKMQFVNDSTGWCVGDSSVIFKTTNGGSNWYRQSFSLNSVLHGIFMLNENEGWICGSRYIAYTSDGGGPVGISNFSENIPEIFQLFQNYPNPFNPSTKINFDIPSGKSGNVKLVIYNSIGKEMATLVNESLLPGVYEVEWNASGFPSGIYFCKLETGNFSETKRMVLLK